MTELNDIGAVETPPPARPTLARSARRIRWPVILVLLWATLAVADIVIFHSRLDSRPASAAKQAVSPGVVAPLHAGAGAPSHVAPTKATGVSTSVGPTAPAKLLVPVSASAFGPGGYASGDDPQHAYLAIDASMATAWTTSWYTTARFGNLQAGTGLLIDMGHPVRVANVQIILGSVRGADLQLLTGDVPALVRMRLQASATDVGGALQLNLATHKRERYLLIWFTLLPPDSSGTYQASIYNIRIKGTSWRRG
jgi:hypothetical protein